MSISSRIHDTIEDWVVEWRDRLRGWLASSILSGVERAFDFFEPGLRAEIKPSVDRLLEMEGMPDDIRNILSQATTGPGAIQFVAILPYLIGILIGLGMGAAAPMARLGAHQIDKLVKSFRMDPLSVITAWRRDPAAYEHMFQDLKDQGWNDDRIEALKFLTLIYPSRQDLQRYVAKEALEPEAIEKYGLMDEFDRLDLTMFDKIGVERETARLDWIAHWEHASWMQVVEMLHRGLITEAEVWEWFRLVEIPPFWRQLLIDSAYTWPTRVDVRRWWDMRTIDETELRRLYSGMGYRGVNLDNYVLWTKVYVAFPDLMARWSKGWISLDDVRAELVALGMPAARVEEMIQTKIKSSEPERTATERDITKTDIYKGVKQGIITRGEGVELLQDLGYDEDEADYLLIINIPRDQEDEVVRQRELSKTDIKAGLKQEVLTEAEARERLLELRYNPADVEFLLNIYKVVADPPVETKLKEASKADIVLGVKKGLITPSEAHEMLLDLGYDPEAADFILLVKAEQEPFSPKSFGEFKDITAKYRRAAGMETTPVPEDLKAAADELVKVKLEVEALERAVKEERGLLTAEEVVPDAATKKLKQLEVKLNRARAELQRIQLNYDSLVAAWKHGAE